MIKEGRQRKTPLWYYILREADVCEGGHRLGPVGGRIVAEDPHGQPTLTGHHINQLFTGHPLTDRRRPQMVGHRDGERGTLPFARSDRNRKSASLAYGAYSWATERHRAECEG